MNFMHIRTVKGTHFNLEYKSNFSCIFLCLLSNLDEILNRHPQNILNDHAFYDFDTVNFTFGE